MENLKVALLQLLPGKSQEENLKKGLDFCRKAKTMGADIALFPEMWNCGYTIPEDREALRALAVPADSGFVMAFGSLAELHLWKAMNRSREIRCAFLTAMGERN